LKPGGFAWFTVASGEYFGNLRHPDHCAAAGRLLAAVLTVTSATESSPLTWARDLDHHQLDHVNDSLTAKPVEFHMDLFGLADGPQGIFQTWTSGRISLLRQQWVKALEESGLAQTLFTEIVVPKTDDQRLGKEVEALGKALQLRFNDEARMAVGHCRIALDEAKLSKKGLNVNKE